MKITSSKEFALDELLIETIQRLQTSLREAGAETAHLKAIGLWEGFYGVANLVSNDGRPELSLPSNCNVKQADFVVNARVAIDPDELRRMVTSAVEGTCRDLGLKADWRDTRSFRPGRPVPTHRLAAQV